MAFSILLGIRGMICSAYPSFYIFQEIIKEGESSEAPFAVDYRNITLHCYYYCRCDEDGESRLSKDPGDNQSSNPQMLTHPSASAGDSLSRYALILPNFRKQSLCVHIQL